MPLLTTLRAESMPQFGSLTYNQQQEVRMATLVKDLEENYPQFQNLSPDQKQQVIGTVLKQRKPVYSDPEFASVAEDFISKIEQGDKQAIGIFMQNLSTRSAMNSGMIASAVALGGMKLNDWLSDNVRRDQYIQLATSKFLKGTDSDKFYAYVSQNLFKGDTEARRTFNQATGAMKAMGGVSGFATDLLAMWGGTSLAIGTAAKAGKAATGVTRIAQGAESGIIKALGAGRISTTTAKIGGWASRVGIPALTDALVGGTYGVARENIIGLATGDTDRLTDSVREFGRAFGEFAAWDLTLGMVIPTALGFLKGAGRRIFGKGDDIVRKRMSDIEYKALMDRFGSGELNKMQFEQLTEVGKDMYAQRQAVSTLGGKTEDLFDRPFLSAQVQANNNGYFLRQLDDGKVRLTKQIDVKAKKGKPRKLSYQTETYDSFLDAYQDMANDIVYQRKYVWNKKQIADFDSNPHNASLLQAGVAINNVNEKLDPIYKLDLDDEARKAIRAGRTDDYVSPVRRLGVTKNEADKLVTEHGAFRVSAGNKEDLARQLEQTPRRFLSPGQSHTLDVYKGGDDIQEAILIANTPAPDDVYQEATEYARTALRKEPTILESEENLRSLILLENGFDSHIKRAPDGSISAVETFIPNRVRVLSEFEELRQAGKIDITQIPRVTRVNNKVRGVKVSGTTIVGDEASVYQYLAKHENPRDIKNMSKVLGTDDFQIYKTAQNNYIIDVPEVGMSREFKSLKEARKFASTKWNSPEVVFAEASRRAIPVSIDDGIYKFTNPDGSYTYAKNKDQVMEFFRKHPEPVAAKEIFEELDPGFTSRFEDVIMSQDQSLVPPGTMKTDLSAANAFVYSSNEGNLPLTLSQQTGRLTAQTNYLAEEISKRVDSPELMSSFRGMTRAERIKNGEFHQVLESTYSDIFTTSTGTKYWKPKYSDRRKMMYYYIAGQGDDVYSAQKYQQMVQTMGELTEEELQMAGRLRVAYNSFGKRFGINFDQWVNSYQPRIRDFLTDTDNAQFLKTTPLMDDVLPQIFGGKNQVPKNLTPWFKNERTLDALQFAVEDDAMFAFIKYADKGLTEQYMKPAWDELRSTLTQVGNADVTEFMTRYASKALNTFHTAGEEVMGKLGTSFANALNGKFAKAGRQIGPKEASSMMQTLYTLNYLTNMAYRPWLAVRNAFQIFTTLAPRMGNQTVNEALRLTHKQMVDGDALIDTLRSLGVLDRKPPIRGELGGIGTRLNRVSHSAFKMFKGSDDYTRLVAYNTGSVLMDRAYDAIRRGDIDLNTINGKRAFLELSGLGKTDKFLADEVFTRVKRGFEAGENADILASAKLTWGQKLIDDTMFIYNQSQAPMMFDGVVGKAFGRYGTYSVGYRANLWRGLKYGSTADKVGFVTRFIGNQAALWGAFSALGIKATNFFPGQPAVFTGGPMFDLALTIMKSADTSSYDGRQARGELGNALQQLVPGTLQYNYLKKAIGYVDKGDWWRGFLSITSTPVQTGPMSLL